MLLWAPLGDKGHPPYHGWSTCRFLFSKNCFKTILRLQTRTEGQYFQSRVSDLILSFYFNPVTVVTWNKFPYLRLRLITWLRISPRPPSWTFVLSFKVMIFIMDKMCILLILTSPCNTRSDVPLCVHEKWSQDVIQIAWGQREKGS